MTTDEPFGLLITWTCYGTWLPGDPRGHVSNVLLPEGGFLPKQNEPRTPVAPGDEHTLHRARELQKGPTVWLSPAEALSTAEALVASARQRQWHIPRAAVMANHVHVVIVDCPADGPAVRRILKGTSQAALGEATGKRQRWWTAGGSDRYLHGPGAIAGAIRYVAAQARILAEVVDMGPRAGSPPA